MQHFDDLSASNFDSITISTLACWYSGSAINRLLVVVLYCCQGFKNESFFEFPVFALFKKNIIGIG